MCGQQVPSGSRGRPSGCPPKFSNSHRMHLAAECYIERDALPTVGSALAASRIRLWMRLPNETRSYTVCIWGSFLYHNCLKLTHVCYQVVHLLCEVIDCIHPCGLIARTIDRDSNYSVLVCFSVLFCLVFWLISHVITFTLSPGDIISLTEYNCDTIQKLLICSWFYDQAKKIKLNPAVMASGGLHFDWEVCWYFRM
jgi:hypothetical protein